MIDQIIYSDRLVDEEDSQEALSYLQERGWEEYIPQSLYERVYGHGIMLVHKNFPGVTIKIGMDRYLGATIFHDGKCLISTMGHTIMKYGVELLIFEKLV